jgi:hypothetical protein
MILVAYAPVSYGAFELTVGVLWRRTGCPAKRLEGTGVRPSGEPDYFPLRSISSMR